MSQTHQAVDASYYAPHSAPSAMPIPAQAPSQAPVPAAYDYGHGYGINVPNGPQPGAQGMPNPAPTQVFPVNQQAGFPSAAQPGFPGRQAPNPPEDDPFEAYFRPPPGVTTPHTMTQVMAPVPVQHIPAQPAYDQPINYQGPAGGGPPYGEQYEPPYDGEYGYDDGPAPQERSRSSRPVLIGIGVAAAALLVVVVSLGTLGGRSAPPAKAAGTTEVVNPTTAPAPSTDPQAATDPASESPSATPSPTPKTSAHIAGALQLGDSGADVKWLQTRLKQLHLYNGQVNGFFDQATAAAVKRFQGQAHPADPSGVVGRSTKTALIAWGSKPKLSAPLPGQDGRHTPSSEDVKRLQRALASALDMNVAASGKYDMATVAAVIQYQAAVGLAPDGAVGDKVWSALQSGKIRG